MLRLLAFSAVAICCLSVSTAQAQVIQEFVLRQPNPHADILPHPLYNAWIPYRKEYNRPRPIGGFIAYVIEPTSQSAMAWDENYHEGNYGHPRKPAHYHVYNYPKPWEALNVGARPDHPASHSTSRSNSIDHENHSTELVPNPTPEFSPSNSNPLRGPNDILGTSK